MKYLITIVIISLGATGCKKEVDKHNYSCYYTGFYRYEINTCRNSNIDRKDTLWNATTQQMDARENDYTYDKKYVKEVAKCTGSGNDQDTVTEVCTALCHQF